MKRVLGLVVGLLVALGVSTPAYAAGEFVINSLNTAFFKGFENLFNSQGQYKAPSIPVVGDYLAGIFNIQDINVGGNPPHFESDSSPVDQISGIFAQQVTSVVQTGVNSYFITFGTPTISTFCNGADCFNTGLVGDEMFRVYRDIGGTAFAAGSTMADGVARSTDGTLWLSLTATGGYAYGEPTDQFGQPKGNAFLGLNVVFNGTGYEFALVNDPGESLFNNNVYLYSTAEFGSNSIGGTPWDTELNDPAVVLPVGIIPEPTSMALMGLGLVGMAIRRKKLVA